MSRFTRVLPPAVIVPIAVVLAVAGLVAVPPAPSVAATGSSDWTTISAGDSSTCGIREGGRLYCWGANDQGQLGIASNTAESSPTRVLTRTPPYTSVSVGAAFACALQTDHSLWCWGDNAYGQLGDGTTTDRNEPAPVQDDATTSAHDWTAVSVGSYHVCARKKSGRLYCWGRNADARVGDGTTTDRVFPTQVAGAAKDWTVVSAGRQHTCARKKSGRLYCWGYNAYGQLGDGTKVTRTTPTQVAGSSTKWTGVSAGGYHTCALQTKGRLFCWGQNGAGQIGSESIGDITSPVQVLPGAQWTAYATGGYHSCGRLKDGHLSCWGENIAGQTGTGDSIPLPVAGHATDWATVDGGLSHTCALTRTGRAFCWGANASGQLGNGTTAGAARPVEVSSGSGTSTGSADWTTISAGWHHTCGIRTGHLYCWGYNGHGQLGNASTNPSSTPVEVSGGFADWTTVSVGGAESCGRRTNGRLYCWGDNSHLQLGVDNDVPDRTSPVEVSGGFHDWTAVSVSNGFGACARRSNGHLYCWGDNDYGQVGDGTTVRRKVPTAVAGPAGWASVDMGSLHTCARKKKGQVYCWGSASYGQLGSGLTDHPLPTLVGTSSTKWTSVSTGDYTTCGRRTSGHLFCWGLNNTGQVGDDTATLRSVPTEVTGGAKDWTLLAAGGFFECAGKKAGALDCWGADDKGQLGDGTTTDSSHPIPVAGGATDWSRIDSGRTHACAVTSTGRAYCWGLNIDGQLGDGTTTDRGTPVEVLVP